MKKVIEVSLETHKMLLEVSSKHDLSLKAAATALIEHGVELVRKGEITFKKASVTPTHQN